LKSSPVYIRTPAGSLRRSSISNASSSSDILMPSTVDAWSFNSVSTVSAAPSNDVAPQ
jgi:hypothetical protein